MRQDTDVARVAAALRAPAIRYRSFGNEPVRTPLPTAEPDPYALLGAAMNAAAEVSQQQGLPPSEPWQPPEQQVQPQQSYLQKQDWPAPAAPEPQTPEAYAPEPPTQAWPAPGLVENWSQTPAAQTWPAPAAPSWPAPAAPGWPEPAAPSWPAAAAQAWPQQAVASGHEAPPAWPAAQPIASPAAESHWAEAAPTLPIAVREPAAPQPSPMPSPAMAQPSVAAPAPATPLSGQVETPGWTAAPLKAEPAVTTASVPAKPSARVVPTSYGVADMSLLRAADAPQAPAAKPALSTLSALSVAPPVKQAEARHAAPRALFPLIEALDLPGGLMARRGLRQDPEAETVAPEPEPQLPVILDASEIELPLSALLRLLASDAATSAEGFLALRDRVPQRVPVSGLTI